MADIDCIMRLVAILLRFGLEEKMDGNVALIVASIDA